ncbi:MAG TPA: four helix bundle protein [Cytophagaceae bacterium]|jgi:four helix bundle protein|nr:four helix bundle protein [Cytophagaceae bacterium]
MGKIERFEDLKCWQESRSLVKRIFTICEKSRLSKDYDLKSQFRRAALSSMNNIAEGFARYHQKEFVRFLDYSQSSLSEVKSIVYVLEDMKYIEDEDIKDLHASVDKTRNLTLGLIKYINRTTNAIS